MYTHENWEKNKEVLKQKHKEDYQKHREKRLEYARAYYQKHKEEIKKKRMGLTDGIDN